MTTSCKSVQKRDQYRLQTFSSFSNFVVPHGPTLKSRLLGIRFDKTPDR